jgi:hypothetical protein
MIRSTKQSFNNAPPAPLYFSIARYLYVSKEPAWEVTLMVMVNIFISVITMLY